MNAKERAALKRAEAQHDKHHRKDKKAEDKRIARKFDRMTGRRK